MKISIITSDRRFAILTESLTLWYFMTQCRKITDWGYGVAAAIQLRSFDPDLIILDIDEIGLTAWNEWIGWQKYNEKMIGFTTDIAVKNTIRSNRICHISKINFEKDTKKSSQIIVKKLIGVYNRKM